MQSGQVKILALLLISLVSLSEGKIHFREEFSPGWEKRFSGSKWNFQNQGRFVLAKNTEEGALPHGIQTWDPSRYHEASIQLLTPIHTKASPFIFQYSVNFAQQIDCGGGYIKLLGEGYNATNFGGDTHFLIMFGPDICGLDSKIQFILDKEGVGYPWGKHYRALNDQLNHFYTFALYPNETYEYYLDAKLLHKGIVAKDWHWEMPKEIPDPNDKKPETWDDRQTIEDANDVKPNDWVEEEMMENNDAIKPDDWDEDKDGVWEPPKIKNPKYKGPWAPRQIKNPNYKGVWNPKMIPNQDYKDQLVSDYVIAGVGIDLWQVTPGTILGHFMITDDISEALEHATKVLEKQATQKVTKEKKVPDKEEAQKKEEPKKDL